MSTGQFVNGIPAVAAGGNLGARMTAPWSLVFGTFPSSPSDVIPVKIAPRSLLFKSDDPADLVTVASLSTEMTLASGDLVWLKIKYFTSGDDIGLVDTVTLVSGSPWDGFPDPVKLTGAGTLEDPQIPDESYFELGFCVASSDDSYGPGLAISDSLKVVSRCASNLLLTMLVTSAGQYYVTPTPWFGQTFTPP